MRKYRAKSGFTLLEIIIVIAIMGFLVAMIAPRLGGIGQEAQANVDDTNLQRLTECISYEITQDTLLPNVLVNLVSYDGTAYALPAAGTLSVDFIGTNHLNLHILDATEAAALNNMGLTRVLILDHTVLGAYAEVPVAAGLGVAMIGGGSADAAALVTADAAIAVNGVFSLPDNIFRMVFGINNDCELVTGGMVSTAPSSPGSAQSDDYTYGLYNIVFPRLASTVLRLPLSPATLTVTGVTTSQVRTVDVTGNQEPWQFTTVSPEGKNWPTKDNTAWTITGVV